MSTTASNPCFGALAAALLLCACSPEVADLPPPNVLLISVDSLRADHLGCYGYERDTSPAIDALADGGVIFEHAIAQAPWTLPSHTSLLTSLYSRTHQVNDVKRQLAPQVPTLASVLEEAGYATRAVVSGPFMQARFGLGKGFQVYDDTLAKMGHRESHEAVTATATYERAMELLEDAPEPFFLFVHFWDVHYDYKPPAPYDTQFDPDYAGSITSERFMKNEAIHPGMAASDLDHIEALYDGEIAWTDEHIAKLLTGLAQRGVQERTIVVLTADHGDEFFEHGEKGHMHSLYEEQVHVPLVMRVPGLAAPQRVSQSVGLVDVMPTLLDELGLAAPSTLQGRSLAALLHGEALQTRPVFSETTKARKNKSDKRKSESWCAYDAGRKLILFDAERYPPELYDLAQDPGETLNLLTSDPQSPLHKTLGEWLVHTPLGPGIDNDGVDSETLQHLKSLGYVGDD